MSFNNNPYKMYKVLQKHPNADFSYLFNQYKIRKIIGFENIYNIDDTIYIEKNLTINNNITVSNSLTCNNLSAINIITNNITVLNDISSSSIITDIISLNSIITTDLSSLTNVICNDILTDSINLVDTFNVSNTNNFNNLSSSNIVFYDNLTILSNISVTNELKVLDQLNCTNLNSTNIEIINISTPYTTSIDGRSKYLVNQNALTCNNTIIDGHITLLNNFNYSDDINIENNLITTNISISNNLNVGNLRSENMFVKNIIYCYVNDYSHNIEALANGVPVNGLYRTGDLLKVCVDTNIPIITLLGNPISYSYINNKYIDPGISKSKISNTIISGTIDKFTLGSYNLEYYSVDNFNNKSNTVTRLVNVINHPIISNITLNSGIISFSTSGQFDTIEYLINKNELNVVDVTTLNGNNIDINSLVLDSTPYSVIVLFKQENNLIKKVLMGITSTYNIDPVLEINMNTPFIINIDDIFNLNNVVNSYTLPSTPIQLTIEVKDNEDNIIILTENSFIPDITKNYNIKYTSTSLNGISIVDIIPSNVEDNTNPIITLLGDIITNINVGTTYIEPGYNISDNTQASIKSVHGYVNTDVIGVYYITYTAIDLAGNSSSIVRTINVNNII